MEEWKEYKLGDILNFRRGHDLPKTKMIEGDIPVGGSNGIIGYHNEYTPITPCITIGRSGNVGTPYIYDKCWAHNTVLYIDDFKGNDPKFLYYLLKTLPLSSFGGGSAVPTLNRNHIHPLIVKFCKNLTTQQKIANILSSLDDKIEVNRRINEQLEELAQALFKSWFVDFEPFKDGEFVESELGMIPEGWKVGTLGELCVTNKRTYGSKFSSEIAYLDTGSVTRNNIESLQTLDPNKNKIPSRARRAVTEGDIVFSSVRPNQKHYAFLFNPQSNMVVSTGFVVITANWSGYRYFIYQYLIQEDIIAKLQAIAEQSVSTYPSINATDITNLQIVIPRRDVIGKFAEINLSFMNEIDKNQREISRLTTLRDTLLPKLMSGEIEVEQLNVIE